MAQARPPAIGEGKVVHIALAVHPGRRDVARRSILLGILGEPEAERGIKIDAALDVGCQDIKVIEALRLHALMGTAALK
jgi:hypothetical protein